MTTWIALVTSLPTENASARMRAWRALKGAGAAVLRDGVYLLPDRQLCRDTLETIAGGILSAAGSALILEVTPPSGTHFEDLFDRSEDYANLLGEAAVVRGELDGEMVPNALRQARRLRKAYAALTEIDYFPGEARRQADAELSALESAIVRMQSPDEPHAVDAPLPVLDPAQYRGRIWATRRRPWVDRLASAWLIRHRIDADARILWLESPGDCPPEALGFDFDGATFTHVGPRVTFEVLLGAFGLATPALERLAAVVHTLDVGGIPPPETCGVESILAGLRDALTDDDQLLASASAVFDGLLLTFEKATKNK